MCFTLLFTQVTMFCEPLAGLFLDFLYSLFSPPEFLTEHLHYCLGLWLNIALLFSKRIRIEGSPQMSKKELIKQVALKL